MIDVVDLATHAPVLYEGKTDQSVNYHLFCSSGLWNASMNSFLGAMRLQVSGDAFSDGEWRLKGIRLMNDNYEWNRFTDVEAVHRFDFDITYYGTNPIAWKTRQAVIRYGAGSIGNEIKKTVLLKTGRMHPRSWEVHVGTRTRQYPRKPDQPVFLVESALIHALQWPFDVTFSKSGCFFDSFTVLRSGGRVYYDGETQTPDEKIFHTFVLGSSGALPFDFWMDEKHRLIACIQGSFGPAYIPSELVKIEHAEGIRRELARSIEL